jgi:hypothetical protein
MYFLSRGLGVGANDPTLENTLVAKSEEAIAEWKRKVDRSF